MLLVASLLLVVRPGAPSSVALVPSSEALVTSSDSLASPLGTLGPLCLREFRPHRRPAKSVRTRSASLGPVLLKACKDQEASSNRCHASSSRCLTSSNKKLVVTGATLVVTGALLVVTRS